MNNQFLPLPGRNQQDSLVKVGLKAILFPLALLALSQPKAQSGKLQASDGVSEDFFGVSVSLSGNFGLVGANGDDIGSNMDQGSAYIFRNLDTATGNVTENAKLTASDGAADDQFGLSVSVSGTIGLVGAFRDDIGSNTDQGSAYLFHNLDTANGTINQTAKLIASDGQIFDFFGYSVSLSGNIGMLGALGGDGLQSGSGAAYLFRNLDTANGTIYEFAKLIASSGSSGDEFGSSVSLSGTFGLVGARSKKVGTNEFQGMAFLFRNLDTVGNGTHFEDASLLASDGDQKDLFGYSVSLSGTTGLVGAPRADSGSNTDQGAAYVFRNLHTANGTMFQNAKLIASDGATGDQFGSSVSLSSTIGLVGAFNATIGSNIGQGAAYLFRNLDTATGTVTQNLKLIASDGASNDSFGSSVALDGDRFLIGAHLKNSGRGKAYSGTVRTFLTADLGNDATQTDGLSFISWENWIVGQTTSNNTITLSGGDTGNVTQSGTGVFVGQSTSSNNNTLSIALNALLISNNVTVGNALNQGNRLALNGEINLTSGSSVVVNQNGILTGNGTITGGAGLIATGSVRPGNNGLGRLTVNGSSVTWNSGNAWVFELGTASSSLSAAFTSNNTQDWLLISFSLFKGTGSSFTFDFAGTGQQGWYKLIDFSGTNFLATDFSGINLASGLFVGNFVIDSGTSALYVEVIPEPATWLLLAAGLTTLVIARRRKGRLSS